MLKLLAYNRQGVAFVHSEDNSDYLIYYPYTDTPSVVSLDFFEETMMIPGWIRPENQTFNSWEEDLHPYLRNRLQKFLGDYELRQLRAETSGNSEDTTE